MDVVEFLDQLRSLDVRISADGELLRLSAPSGVLTEQLTAEVKKRKPEILQYLHSVSPIAGARISRRSERHEHPASSAQERMWFLENLESSAAYNIPAGFRLRGPLDIVALQRSLAEVVARHEALRTTLPWNISKPVQRVSDVAGDVLAIIDLTGLPVEERAAHARRCFEREEDHRFDLVQGPLYRFQLLVLDEREHVLLLNVHHIIFDLPSWGILFRELSALYDARRRGVAAALPPPPIHYGDFAAWQRELDERGSLHAEQVYWQTRLAVPPPPLELPTDHPRPPARSSRGAEVPIAISAEITAALRRLAQAEHASVFMALLAAFFVLLRKYSGQERLAIGAPVANRSLPETNDVIGVFINTLVFTADLAGDPSFRDVVRQVRETTLQCLDHSRLPFEQLVETLNPPRSLSRNPLFDVMLVVREHRDRVLALCDLEVEPLHVDTRTTKVDLTLSLVDDGERLTGRLEYSADLFEAATATRMAEHFARLLDRLVRDADRPIGASSLLSPAEEHLVLVRWNETTLAPPPLARVDELFEAQVDRTPDALALAAGATRWSYRQLDERANRIAHLLRDRGVGPGELVGVALPRTADLVATLLAVWKVGAAYLPLDGPEQRQQLLRADIGVRIIVAEGQRAAAQATDIVIDLAHERTAIAAQPGSRCERPHDIAALAYVIATSGSTGRPKGVAIEHRNVTALLHWAHSVYPLELLRGALAATSISFDLSSFELFVPLTRGGAVILVENVLALTQHKDGLPEITLLNTVPSAMAQLLAARAVPRTVRVVNLAGEPLSTSLADRIYDETSAEKVYDLYGPSEATTYSTFSERGRGDPPNIGRAIAHTRVYVLDEHGAPVPIGVPGEIYIGGLGVARGYLGQPSRDADRFIADPFCEGARLYRTGDLARWRADGRLEFRGRRDRQIKLRGYRIELGEIEAALRRHHQIADAAVVLRGAGADAELVAYVESQGETPSIPELRAHLKRALPDYMVPPLFVVLPALPRSPGGKIELAALPAPDGAQVDADKANVDPQSFTEELLANIWCEVLGVPRVNRRDQFFELRGNSLLVIQLLAHVREVFGVELPLRTVFEHPILEELAAAIDRVKQGAHVEPMVIRPLAPGEKSCLSPIQEANWQFEQLLPGTPFLTVSLPLRFEGPLDAQILEHALGEVVRRHEILRTSYVVEDEVVRPIVDPEASVSITTIDLEAMAPEARARKLRQVASAAAHDSFDLKRGPLIRFALVKLESREHVLIVTAHHMIFDGWSAQVFTRELALIYAAFAEGRASPLAPMRVQFSSYARWERDQVDGPEWRRQLAYWTHKLAAPRARLDIPGQKRRLEPSFRVARYPIILDADTTAALRQLGRQAGATLFMVLFAAYDVFLHAASGVTDLRIATIVANRARPGLEELIGAFANMVVVRTALAPERTFLEHVRTVREAALDAYANVEIPFQKVELAVTGHVTDELMNICQSTFIYQPAPLRLPVDRDGLLGMTLLGQLRSLGEVEYLATRFDLTAEFVDHETMIEGIVTYKPERFDLLTIVDLARRFQQVLGAVAREPKRSVAALVQAAESSHGRS